MDALKREIGTCKSSFERNVNWISNFLESQTDTFELSHRRTHLINAFNNYNDICNKIDTHKNADMHTENREEVENKHFSAMSRIDGKLAQFSKVNSSPSVPSQYQHGNHANFNVRLPPVSVPIYHGEPSKWVSFYQLFSSIIKDNQTLTKAQKLIYLKSSLRGEPLNLIDSLDVTNENFDLAIDILERKYDNCLAIINSHINLIIDFPTLTRSNYRSLVILQTI
ncbi:uncharacterized protein LOC126882616 [Diabrotica virgifera virgifera]|uniref:Uncharacterized protein n=1 Tax=Diabrotica virgifera virgifera TaxID=50390 RepID=A0ABM5K032_DIAVI|nr:uncharacterized protein LOC126882616 [Diabrotica virgifera virgifera]